MILENVAAWLKRDYQQFQLRRRRPSPTWMRPFDDAVEGLVNALGVALAAAALIGLPIGALFLLVRFVKWAWTN